MELNVLDFRDAEEVSALGMVLEGQLAVHKVLYDFVDFGFLVARSNTGEGTSIPP